MSSVPANVSPPSLPPSNPSDESLPSQVSTSRSGKDGSGASNRVAAEQRDAAASLMLSAVKDVRQIIRLVQCQLCSKVLVEPTTLPCGYSICKSCLPETHDRTNISWPAATDRLRGFECPFQECAKEHAVADCAVDVTLNKVLTIIKEMIELDRDVVGLSNVSTHVLVQDRWAIAGLSSMDEKEPDSKVLKGGRIVATYTMAESGTLEYGCEVMYSAVGVGDDVVEAIDVGMLARLKESARTEMDCQVCYGLFLDPMTTTCGHTFCRTCLHRVLDHSSLCPICRRELSIRSTLEPQSFPSNERLCKIIDGFWADLVALRSQAQRLEQQANYGGFDIPLFVCTLSFPHTPLFLHVFEPRYRLMIRRAMEADRTFGMVMARPAPAAGETHFMELGTLLRIVNIEFFPDGRSLLETRGVSRFKVTRHGWLDGYVVGNIEKVDDISVADEEALEAQETARRGRDQDIELHDQPLASAEPAPSAPDLSAATSVSLTDLETMPTQHLVNFGIDIVQRMRAQSVPWLAARVIAIYGECPPDPAVFPWWFASILPLKDAEKYKLLSTSSVRERLKICCRWIVEWETSRWTISGCLVL
ncbi:hypothetical protein F5Y15DRAFT_258636 [Xylariaceae sp. FL0016]|nr:hypothetical protein F5Y15DRAFT_258636 [Xylariaceae sp. FL0016]